MQTLNTQSPIPLYHQLADIILSKIRSGEYLSGSKIPSENSLAENYGIGRPTARQATDILVRKGILVRKRGAGTFVEEKRKEVDLFSLAGTISSFHKKGYDVSTSFLSSIQLITVGKDTENPFSNKKAYFLSRVSRIDDEPVLIEDIYLDETVFSGIDQIDLTDRSLSQVVDENYYMKPTSGKQNFRIGYLTKEKAGYLAISHDEPILWVRRYLNFQQTNNAIYSELFCRTDRFAFSQILGGDPND